MTLLIEPEAEADVAAVFRDELERILETIDRHPQMYQALRRGARRAPLRGFPWSVVYLLRGEQIRVVACFHHKVHQRRLRPRLRR